MTTETEFDRALAMRWEEHAAVAVGSFELSEDWLIGGVVNGGLLMALCTQAAVERCGVAGHVHPVAWSSQFASAARPGRAEVRLTLTRAGRSFTSVSVDLLQGGEERLRTLVTLGRLDELGDTVYAAPPPPLMPPPDQCLRADRSVPSSREVVLLDRLDLRLDPATAMWAVGQPSKAGRMRGWLRFADNRPVDAGSLPFFLDAMPPVAFDVGGQGWAPTVAFLGSVRAEPQDGWLQMEITTSTVVGGLLEEDATIWDRSGRVVAHSRQIAGFRMSGGALP